MEDFFFRQAYPDAAPTLEQFAHAVMERCYTMRCAKALYAVRPDEITVRCDLRGKSRAGIAHAGEMWIRLSPAYYAALGEKYAATITFIGSKISITWNTADINPYSIDEVRWAQTRKGAFGITLNEGSELKISRLRIRELR